MNASAEVNKKEAVAVPPSPKRKRAVRRLLMLAVPVLLVLGGGYVWLTGGRYESTENANLHQAKVSITSEVSGRVVKVAVSDNQHVKAGDMLFRVDPEPYRIALAQADAALSAARLNVAQLRASYAQAEAEAKVVADDVAFYQSEYDRQKALTEKGIASASSLDSASRNLRKAEEQQVAAQQAIESARAALGGDPDIKTGEHPSVLAAQAARDKAAYDLERTTVRAPADGVVYQAASFKPGEFVAPGSALFALVETGDTWVEANFKETQLTNLKPGQTADVEFDTYPGRTFTARVSAIGAGTGAEFSLLPAQNATGNWVKVTQRVPVRLALDDPATDLMLRTGMSATVTVDTHVSRSLAGVFAAFAGHKD